MEALPVAGPRNPVPGGTPVRNRLESSAPPGALTSPVPSDRVVLSGLVPPEADEVEIPGTRPPAWAAAAALGLAILGAAGLQSASPGPTAALVTVARTMLGLEGASPQAGPQVPAGLPLREQVARAAARRPVDPPEARQTRNRYAQLHRDLEAARDRMLSDLARLGEGTHATAGGFVVTLAREGPDVVTARYSHEEPGRFLSVRASTKNADEIRMERGEKPTLLTASRWGTRVEAREFGRYSEAYTLDGEVLVHRTPKEELRIQPDGETAILPLEGEGRLATVILPHYDHSEREQILARASFRLLPDGTRKPLDPETLDQLALGAQAYAPEVLRLLAGSGVTWVVADPHPAPPGGFPGRNTTWPPDATEKQEAGGYYTAPDKTVVLRSDMLYPDMVTHEIGHALDDLGAPDRDGVRWESEQEPQVRKMYEAYLERSKDPEKIWSDYARINLHEYYAKGFELYQGPPSERDRLQSLDPDLYRFVEGRLLGLRP